MALFDNMKESLLYDPLDIFNEFDAGSGTNQNDEDEELETIEDDETEDPEDADDTQDANPDDDQEDEELETIEDDEADQTDTDIQADEQPEQNQTDNDETQPADDNQNQEGEGEGDINPNDGGEGDEELETIDDDNDGLDDGQDDTSTDDSSGGDMDTSTDENDPHKKLKELEAEIFDQLSEEEKEMKRNELKKLYVLLIEKAESIFNLTQEITKTDDTVKLIDYVLNTLMDLKTYLGDYVSDVYDNRTYLQNNVNFQKFLAIFDSIHAIFQEIIQMDEKKY